MSGGFRRPTLFNQLMLSRSAARLRLPNCRSDPYSEIGRPKKKGSKTIILPPMDQTHKTVET